MRGSCWLTLLLTLALAGCSDDGESPKPDGPSGGDMAVADQGTTPTPDTGSTDQGPLADQGPAPDGAGTPDAAPANSFNLELTVDFGLILGCSAGDATKDCQGDIYWSVYDQVPPTNPNNPGNPIFEAVEKNAKKGTVLKGVVPLAAKLYVAAFMDDNNNVDPQNVKPDKGDPVYTDNATTFFTATAGQTVKRPMKFQLRMPF